MISLEEKINFFGTESEEASGQLKAYLTDNTTNVGKRQWGHHLYIYIAFSSLVVTVLKYAIR